MALRPTAKSIKAVAKQTKLGKPSHNLNYKKTVKRQTHTMETKRMAPGIVRQTERHTSPKGTRVHFQSRNYYVHPNYAKGGAVSAFGVASYGAGHHRARNKHPYIKNMPGTRPVGGAVIY